MKAIAVRAFPRPPEEAAKRLAAAGVATVHEAQGRRGLARPYLRPIWATPCVAGPAVTVLAPPGDNWMLHAAVELCRPGDMVVVAVSSDNSDGMFGELLATSFKAHGVIGTVIDAGCRDVAALREMRYPVWSRAVSAQGTVKATPGAVNVPVIIGGVAVSPGDVVVADEDGVVIVPRDSAVQVAEASEARLRRENEVRARLARGELGLDIYGMRGSLEDRGLRYVDSFDPSRHGE